MLALKVYQQNALDALCQYLRVARVEGAKHAFIEITERGYRAVDQLPGLPYVCLRIPTGGGKTLMACYAVSIAAQEFLRQEHSLVLWLVPTNAIKDQTLTALRDVKHPYRQALDSTLGYRVTVMDLAEALSVQRATLDSNTTLIVSTLAALRVEDTDGRKVYEQNGFLMSHFDNLPGPVAAALEKYQGSDKPVPSLANVLKSRHPIVIVDEAHNARTALSFDTLARFSPSCILEFTATPDQERAPSNVLYHVSASELKAENMIKLPIRMQLRSGWKEALASAIAQRAHLEDMATAEHAATGEYLRPIVLVQAQPRAQNADRVTVEVVKEGLQELGVPEEQIAVETGEAREVKAWEDAHKRTVFDDTCPIRFIITVDKLREGWDCPFAYVLCSVREMGAHTAVEQILGRVLRLPKATRKRHDDLNYAYAFVTSARFDQAANGLVDALVDNGFTRFEARAEVHAQQGPLFDDLPLFAAQDQAQRTPAERGDVFQVPQLALWVDEELEPLEQSHLLHIQWDLAGCNPTLSEEEFPSQPQPARELDVDVDDRGAVRIKYAEQDFAAGLAQQLAMLLPQDDTTPTALVVWLDQHIPHYWEITQEQNHLFLLAMVEALINQRGLTIEQLSRERLRLREAAAHKINEHRQRAMRAGFQQMLFGEMPNARLEVSPRCVFRFDPNYYPLNDLYDGAFEFKKHYYRAVGAMNGEEARCAAAIDALPKVKYWVRNIERQPDFSFWMQTPADKFYPDFVALLEDSRILVVEYKGADRLTTDDTKEKRALGELWAHRSDGQCLFLLVSEPDFEARLRQVAG